MENSPRTKMDSGSWRVSGEVALKNMGFFTLAFLHWKWRWVKSTTHSKEEQVVSRNLLDNVNLKMLSLQDEYV